MAADATTRDDDPGAGSPLGAFLCDGTGGAQELDWRGVRAWRPGSDGWLWLHLDRTDAESQSWLREEAGLPPIPVEILCEAETRPRLVVDGGEMIVILRGVNLNPGAEPDDMIALRILVDAQRVVTMRHRRLLAVMDIREQLLAGNGPRTPGDLLVAITGRLVDRQVAVVDALEDVVDEIDQQIVEAQSHALRSRIAELRRQVIGLRRYLAPQRDVLSRIPHERVAWLDDLQRARVREVAERQVRLVEELDSARERAAVAQEELAGRLAEQMNRNMYVLSLVAGIFLPLGLLTGLLGINVGGIPGSDDRAAFAIVCGILVVLAGVVLFVFRRFKMI